jgi:hypothetical protein
VHPFPGRPESDCRANHQQASGEEDIRLQGSIEPAPSEEGEQHRNYDHPAEDADLAQPGTERGFRDLAAARGKLDSASRNMGQGVRVARSRSMLFGRGHDAAS